MPKIIENPREKIVDAGYAAMTNFFHEMDDTRLVHYEGCFWNPDFAHIRDMESRMYAKPQQIDASCLAAKPKKPYISCEFLHCMGTRWLTVTDDSWGAPVQRRFWLDSDVDRKLTFIIRKA